MEGKGERGDGGNVRLLSPPSPISDTGCATGHRCTRPSPRSVDSQIQRHEVLHVLLTKRRRKYMYVRILPVPYVNSKTLQLHIITQCSALMLLRKDTIGDLTAGLLQHCASVYFICGSSFMFCFSLRRTIMVSCVTLPW